jgi:hypothetical protein
MYDSSKEENELLPNKMPIKEFIRKKVTTTVTENE